jgi:hypothetical protein
MHWGRRPGASYQPVGDTVGPSRLTGAQMRDLSLHQIPAYKRAIDRKAGIYRRDRS